MSGGAGERFLEGGGAVASAWPPTTAEELLPAAAAVTAVSGFSAEEDRGACVRI